MLNGCQSHASGQQSEGGGGGEKRVKNCGLTLAAVFEAIKQVSLRQNGTASPAFPS